MKKSRQQKIEEYGIAMHALQSGIAFSLAKKNPTVPDINQNPYLRELKHQRVGIDGTKSDHSALVKLLIERGIITDEEYIDAMLEGVIAEVHRYEKALSQEYGVKVTLL